MKTRYALAPAAISATVGALNIFDVLAWSADQVSAFNVAAMAVMAVIFGKPASST